MVQGDITVEDVDVIVNAANSRLAGGGGVDGAIHRAGGKAILAECRKIGGCPTGEAVITTGGNLPARFVIHTVGPVYRDGLHGEPELLTSAYTESLRLALQKGLQSIAFPAISCGVYGYPVSEAARLALSACMAFAQKETGIRLVRHVLFDRKTRDVFAQEFSKLI